MSSISFFLACAHGHIEIVKFLTKLGFDVNIKNEKNENGFFKSCEFGKNLKLIKLFIENFHCDVHMKNKDGDNVLMKHCQIGTNKIFI